MVLKYTALHYNFYKIYWFLKFAIIKDRLSSLVSTSLARIQISFYVGITREQILEAQVIAVYVNSYNITRNGTVNRSIPTRDTPLMY